MIGDMVVESVAAGMKGWWWAHLVVTSKWLGGRFFFVS